MHEVQVVTLKTISPQTSVTNRPPGTSPLCFEAFVEGVSEVPVIFE